MWHRIFHTSDKNAVKKRSCESFSDISSLWPCINEYESIISLFCVNASHLFIQNALKVLSPQMSDRDLVELISELNCSIFQSWHVFGDILYHCFYLMIFSITSVLLCKAESWQSPYHSVGGRNNVWSLEMYSSGGLLYFSKDRVLPLHLCVGDLTSSTMWTDLFSSSPGSDIKQLCILLPTWRGCL